MAYLTAVTEDVKRVLAFEHLLDQVRNDVTHRELDVPAHHVVVAQRAPLPAADAVEGPHDRELPAVLHARTAGNVFGGEPPNAIGRAGWWAREPVPLGRGKR